MYPQEITSGGVRIDADPRREWPRQVHDDSPMMGVFLGPGKKGVGLRPKGEWMCS